MSTTARAAWQVLFQDDDRLVRYLVHPDRQAVTVQDLRREEQHDLVTELVLPIGWVRMLDAALR